MAAERTPAIPDGGSIDFRVGDMLDPTLGRFDHVVAMDSLIHYTARDIVRVLDGLAARTSGSMLITIAPRTPALTVMHAIGKVFPRGDRSPAIEPVTREELLRQAGVQPRLSHWTMARSQRVTGGFYISEACAFVPNREARA